MGPSAVFKIIIIIIPFWPAWFCRVVWRGRRFARRFVSRRSGPSLLAESSGTRTGGRGRGAEGAGVSGGVCPVSRWVQQVPERRPSPSRSVPRRLCRGADSSPTGGHAFIGAKGGFGARGARQPGEAAAAEPGRADSSTETLLLILPTSNRGIFVVVVALGREGIETDLDLYTSAIRYFCKQSCIQRCIVYIYMYILELLKI